jgi:hypothetical protein
MSEIRQNAVFEFMANRNDNFLLKTVYVFTAYTLIFNMLHVFLLKCTVNYSRLKICILLPGGLEKSVAVPRVPDLFPFLSQIRIRFRIRIHDYWEHIEVGSL